MDGRPVCQPPLPENLRERHVGEFPPAPAARKHQPATVVEGAHPLQDGHRLGRQGDPMRCSRLRPLARNAPLAGLPIHLAPPRPARLSGPCRRQDQEPEAETGREARRGRFHRRQRLPYLPVGEGAEMRLPTVHLRESAVDALRCDVTGRKAVSLRPGQDRPDSLAHCRAVSGFRAHIGVSTRSTSSPRIRSTSMPPRMGNAWFSRVAIQSVACLRFRQRGRNMSHVRAAACRKVGGLARRFAASGSAPSARVVGSRVPELAPRRSRGFPVSAHQSRNALWNP